MLGGALSKSQRSGLCCILLVFCGRLKTIGRRGRHTQSKQDHLTCDRHSHNQPIEPDTTQGRSRREGCQV